MNGVATVYVDGDADVLDGDGDDCSVDGDLDDGDDVFVERDSDVFDASDGGCGATELDCVDCRGVR